MQKDNLPSSPAASFAMAAAWQLFRGILFAAVILACRVKVQAQTLLDAEAAVFQSAVEKVSSSVVQLEAFQTSNTAGGPIVGAGPTTGTIVSSDGLIVTSLYGLEEDPTSILAVLPGQRRVPARILARDYHRELVLLKVDAANLPVPAWATQSSVQVGQWAIAVGKTLDTLTTSRSVGIVSALGRAYDKAIQTDAKVSPINYGGPLVDIDGRVIGILSPLSPGSFLEGDDTDLYDSGIGFAIPMHDILARLDTLRQGTDIHRGLLGIVVKDQNELAGPVVITGASPGSPAAKAGLKVDDEIVAAGGRQVAIYAHLQHAIGNRDAGDSFSVSILRDGKQFDVTCELAEEIPVYRRRQLGIYLAAIGKDDHADDHASVQGRTVRQVEAESTAEKAGIRAGDRIVSIGGQAMSELEKVRELLAVAELDRSLTVSLIRNGQEKRLEVQAEEWSEMLPDRLPPPRYPSGEEACTTKQLRLGNFANDVTAILPPPASGNSPGLLVVLAQPGDLDTEASVAHWNDFCVRYGWIVTLIRSQNARAWTAEEIELPSRVVAAISKTTKLDPSRIAFSGIGVGGRLALAAAVDSNQPRGILLLGTQLRRLAVQQPNRPGRSIDFLFIGDPASLDSPLKALQSVGYTARAIPALGPTKNDWAAFPQVPTQIWLEELSKL